MEISELYLNERVVIKNKLSGGDIFFFFYLAIVFWALHEGVIFTSILVALFVLYVGYTIFGIGRPYIILTPVGFTIIPIFGSGRFLKADGGYYPWNVITESTIKKGFYSPMHIGRKMAFVYDIRFRTLTGGYHSIDLWSIRKSRRPEIIEYFKRYGKLQTTK